MNPSRPAQSSRLPVANRRLNGGRKRVALLVFAAPRGCSCLLSSSCLAPLQRLADSTPSLSFQAETEAGLFSIHVFTNEDAVGVGAQSVRASVTFHEGVGVDVLPRKTTTSNHNLKRDDPPSRRAVELTLLWERLLNPAFQSVHFPREIASEKSLGSRVARTSKPKHSEEGVRA